MSGPNDFDPGTSEHARIRRLLAAYAAALLDRDEEERVRAHLDRCAACAESHRLLLASATESDGSHIPASIIARWSVERERLQGIERAMVSRHLEKCASCRADLELLGHEPRLQAEPVRVAVPSCSPVSLEAERQRRRPARDRRLSWWTMGSGWAAAAALTVALLRNPAVVEVVRDTGPSQPGRTPPVDIAAPGPETPTTPDRPSATGGDAGRDTPPRPPQTNGGRTKEWTESGPAGGARRGAGIDFLAAVNLGAMGGGTRGADAVPVTIDVICPHAGLPLILHRAPSAFAGSADTPVRVAVAGPAHFEQRWRTTAGALREHEAIQVFPDGDVFAPGQYTVSFVKEPFGTAEPETLRAVLRLRRAAADGR